MAGSTTKKAVIRRYQRETLAGYVNPVSFLQPTGVELLSEEGQVAVVPYAEIKTVSFVRDFSDGERRAAGYSYTRPKMEGLWVSLKFRDGEVMEGILPNNLLQLDDSRLYDRSARSIRPAAADFRSPGGPAIGRGAGGGGQPAKEEEGADGRQGADQAI